MTIRDIKEILKLIKFKKEHGLDLDKSICKDFERNTKSKNYLFANSIDFIYEFFNFENKIRNNILSKSVRFLGKNKMINKFFTNLADAGISI
jgi:2-octaprenyl-6-methoxyphenol hydroxylase